MLNIVNHPLYMIAFAVIIKQSDWAIDPIRQVNNLQSNVTVHTSRFSRYIYWYTDPPFKDSFKRNKYKVSFHEVCSWYESKS